MDNIQSKLFSFPKPDKFYPVRDGYAISEGVKWLNDNYYIDRVLAKILDYQGVKAISGQLFQVFDFKNDFLEDKLQLEVRNEDKVLLRRVTLKSVNLPKEIDWLSFWIHDKKIMLPIELARTMAE